MYKSYLPYLQHILDECLYVRSVITDEMQQGQFLQDETLKRAVTRSLSIIGEATKKIPVDVKYAWQSISWREMAGMRDRLVHDYMGFHPIPQCFSARLCHFPPKGRKNGIDYKG